MSNLNARAVCNGGGSKPIHFMHEMADPNARLIAAAPDLLSHLKQALRQWAMYAEIVEGSSHDDFNLATEKSPEGDLYRAALAVIAKAEGRNT
jgi:hypothetical protein